TAQALALAASPYPSTPALVTDLQRTAVRALLDERAASGAGPAPEAIRDAEAYGAARAFVREALEDRTFRVAQDVAAVLGAAREVDATIRGTTSLALLGPVADVREQLKGLVHDGFVSEAGAARLPHLVRYLRAAQHRLSKAATDPQRDEGLTWQV